MVLKTPAMLTLLNYVLMHSRIGSGDILQEHSAAWFPFVIISFFLFVEFVFFFFKDMEL